MSPSHYFSEPFDPLQSDLGVKHWTDIYTYLYQSSGTLAKYVASELGACLMLFTNLFKDITSLERTFCY